MTVGELIEKLSGFDPNFVVELVDNFEYSDLEDIFVDVFKERVLLS